MRRGRPPRFGQQYQHRDRNATTASGAEGRSHAGLIDGASDFARPTTATRLIASSPKLVPEFSKAAAMRGFDHRRHRTAKSNRDADRLNETKRLEASDIAPANGGAGVKRRPRRGDRVRRHDQRQRRPCGQDCERGTGALYPILKSDGAAPDDGHRRYPVHAIITAANTASRRRSCRWPPPASPTRSGQPQSR